MIYVALYQTYDTTTDIIITESCLYAQDALCAFYILTLFPMNWSILSHVYPKSFILNTFLIEALIIYLGTLRKIFGPVELASKAWTVCNFFICFIATTVFYFSLKYISQEKAQKDFNPLEILDFVQDSILISKDHKCIFQNASAKILFHDFNMNKTNLFE